MKSILIILMLAALTLLIGGCDYTQPYYQTHPLPGERECKIIVAGIVAMGGHQYKVEGSPATGHVFVTFEQGDTWKWRWKGGGLVCNWNTPYVDVKKGILYSLPHDQSAACYMTLTCYQSGVGKKLTFDGIEISSHYDPKRITTWECSHSVSLPPGMTYEQAVEKMILRYGKKGVLKVNMGPFIYPKSCKYFDVLERDGAIVTFKSTKVQMHKPYWTQSQDIPWLYMNSDATKIRIYTSTNKDYIEAAITTHGTATKEKAMRILKPYIKKTK